MQLPEPFNCPKCESNEIEIDVLTRIYLLTKREVGGHEYKLSSDSQWYCHKCDADGDVVSAGPLYNPNDPKDQYERQTLRSYRRVALDLVHLLNSRGLLNGDIEVWTNDIIQASLSKLLGIIITLQNELNFPEPDNDEGTGLNI